MIDTALQWLGFGLCHQLPARSFFGGGHQVPVCARDTGIYLGFIVSFFLIAALSRWSRPAEAPPRWAIGVGATFIALMALDGLTSYVGLRETSNELRLATGLGAGYAIALFITPMLNAELWRVPVRERPLATWQAGVVWLGSIPLAWAVTYWALPWLGLGYPLLVAAAILVTFTIVNLVLVALVWPEARRPERARDVVLPAVAAFGLTLLELAGAAALKAWAVAAAASAARGS